MPSPRQQSLLAAYDESATAHKAVVSEHSDNDIIRMNYDALLVQAEAYEDAQNFPGSQEGVCRSHR